MAALGRDGTSQSGLLAVPGFDIEADIRNQVIADQAAAEAKKGKRKNQKTIRRQAPIAAARSTILTSQLGLPDDQTGGGKTLLGS